MDRPMTGGLCRCSLRPIRLHGGRRGGITDRYAASHRRRWCSGLSIPLGATSCQTLRNSIRFASSPNAARSDQRSDRTITFLQNHKLPGEQMPVPVHAMVCRFPKRDSVRKQPVVRSSTSFPTARYLVMNNKETERRHTAARDPEPYFLRSL